MKQSKQFTYGTNVMLLASALLLVMVATMACTAVSPNHFSDPDFPVQFNYPKQWEAEWIKEVGGQYLNSHQFLRM